MLGSNGSTVEPEPGSRTDRGVSEVVAFIFIFAIILGSVGILYSVGFGAMTDYQEHEQRINAERAMDSLTNNFNDVVRYNGVNQRFGELALRDGAVTTSDDGTEISITIGGTDLSDEDRFERYHDGDALDLGEFIYRHEGTVLAYEGSGLVRSGESGDWSTMLNRPHVKCSEETAVISIVQVTADDRSVRSGGGLGITMSVENRSSKVYDDPGDVTVNVTDTDYEQAWNTTLDAGGWEGDEESPEGTCGDDLERVVVTVVEVDVDY